MSHRPESNHCPTKRSHLSAEPSVPASGTDNSRSRLTVKVFHCLMYRLLFHKPMRHLVWSISCCWFKRICSKCLTVSVSNRFFHRRTRPEGLHGHNPWESRQIFVHGFFGQYDPTIISAGDQNAQRLHTFFQLVHGFSN